MNAKMEQIMKIITTNKSASFEYFIEEKYEAGIVLEGNEIKSLREGNVNMNDSFCFVRGSDVSVKNMHNLTSFLADYGITVSTNTNEGGESYRNIVKDTTSSLPGDGYTLVGEYTEDELAKSIRTATEKYGSGKVLLREAAALVCSSGKKATAVAVLESSSSAVCLANGVTTDREGSYALAANAVVANEGGKDANVFVLATSYIAATDAIVSDGYSNKDFIYAVFSEVFSAELPPYGCRSIVFETDTLQGLTMGTARAYTVIAVVIPIAIAAVGAVIAIKRKRR